MVIAVGRYLAAIALVATVVAQTTNHQTVAGIFEIKPKGSNGNCEALLAGKLVRSFECEYSYTPGIIAYYDKGNGKFENVVVIQESPMGNACNGGALHILGIQKDGSFSIADPIDFCGGRNPVVEKKETRVRITFPGGPPNRGSGYIPTVVWEYSNGVLKKIK